LHAAGVLAARGIHVVMAGRSMAKLEEAIAGLKKANAAAQLTPMELDLTSFDSVRSVLEMHQLGVSCTFLLVPLQQVCGGLRRAEAGVALPYPERGHHGSPAQLHQGRLRVADPNQPFE
jgi:hypothetical protein